MYYVQYTKNRTPNPGQESQSPLNTDCHTQLALLELSSGHESLLLNRGLSGRSGRSSTTRRICLSLGGDVGDEQASALTTWQPRLFTSPKGRHSSGTREQMFVNKPRKPDPPFSRLLLGSSKNRSFGNGKPRNISRPPPHPAPKPHT